MEVIFFSESSKVAQESVNSTLGARFREIRKEYGYTQDEFSDFLDVDQSLISKIEGGSSGISIEIADPIITQLHISFEWLIHGTGQKYRTGGIGPIQSGLHWRKAVEVVEEVIDQAGIRKKLKEGRIGFLISVAAEGFSEGQDPEYTRQQLVRAIQWIQAKAQSTTSE